MMARVVYLSWRTSRSCFSGLLKSGSTNISHKLYGHIRNITTSGSHKQPLAPWGSSPNTNRGIFHIPSFLMQRASPAYPFPLSASILSCIQQTRSVVKMSKNKGKRKTVKAVAKRFYRTGSGKLKYWPPGKVHNMLAKSNKRRRQLRKARYVTKAQLKTLNKMIYGW